MRLRPPPGVVRTAERLVTWCRAQEPLYTPLEALESLIDLLAVLNEHMTDAECSLKHLVVSSYHHKDQETFVTVRLQGELTMVRRGSDIFREARIILGAPQLDLPY